MTDLKCATDVYFVNAIFVQAICPHCGNVCAVSSTTEKILNVFCIGDEQTHVCDECNAEYTWTITDSALSNYADMDY